VMQAQPDRGLPCGAVRRSISTEKAYATGMVDEDAELRAFFCGTSFFGGLDPPMIDLVMSLLKERHFAKGAIVFKEGENGNSMYVVRSGSLIVTRRRSDGSDVRLLMIRKGDHFGVTALIEMEARPFSCMAEQDTVLYELTNADMYKFYKADSMAYILLLQNISRELCRRLRKAALRIAALEDSLHKGQ